MTSLRILFTNLTMASRSGTEVQTRNYALEMQRRGHQPLVYSQRFGDIAAELRSANIACYTTMADIAQPIDIIHGQHFPTVLNAVSARPGVPALYMCHDATIWFDEAPQLPSIRRYLAVDDAVHDRLVNHGGIAPEKVHTLYNNADVERFQVGGPLPPKPRRALIFAKNRQHVAAALKACALRNIEAVVAGVAVGAIAQSPETLMPQFDLVFASALTAMEAMATGRAVIVCDGRGLAGFCTVERYHSWRAKNFGLWTLRAAPSVDAMLKEIDAYDPGEASRVTTLLRSEGGVAAHAAKLEQHYLDVIAAHHQQPHSVADMAAALASMRRDWDPKTGPVLQRTLARQARMERERPRDVTLDKLSCPDQAGFHQAEPRNWWCPLEGISAPEAKGAWTDGNHARFSFARPTSGPFRIYLQFRPCVPVGKGHTLETQLLVDNQLVGEMGFSTPTMLTLHMDIASAADANASDIVIGFKFANPLSALETGQSWDARKLGLFLCNMRIEPLPPTVSQDQSSPKA